MLNDNSAFLFVILVCSFWRTVVGRFHPHTLCKDLWYAAFSQRGGVVVTVGLDDLGDLFQPEWFYDSMMYITYWMSGCKL